MPRIKNLQRMPFTVNLRVGEDYGPELRPSRVVFAVPVNTDDGRAGVQEVAKILPAAITWRPGETKDVPAAVLEIQEVKRALSMRLLVLC